MVFIYRAAMKMANMDSAFDFMFTNPKDERGVSNAFITTIKWETEKLNLHKNALFCFIVERCCWAQ